LFSSLASRERRPRCVCRLGRSAQARAEALRLRIDGQIADTWFGVDALRKVVQIYILHQLPPAGSSVDNARSGFQSGSTDLFFVLEAERRLRAVQLDLLKLKVELQTKYAEIERTREIPVYVNWPAPQDGEIVERTAVNGMRAAPGDVLFRIVVMSSG
jgi:HlyD family secretion protein/outer membrane efflux protein